MKEYAWIGKDRGMVIILCADILLRKEDKKDQIKEILSSMSKKLNFKIKKSKKMDLELAFRNFITNPRGYVDSIEILYHSL